MGSLEKTKGCFQASVGSNQQFSLESGLVYLDPKKKLVLTGSVGSNKQFLWTRTCLSGSGAQKYGLLCI